MSAISTAAPRLMMASSSSRIWPALDALMCSGSVTIACRPVHRQSPGHAIRNAEATARLTGKGPDGNVLSALPGPYPQAM
jgi:hypothetical protein